MQTKQSNIPLPMASAPCIHAAPLPGELDRVMCVLGVEENPTRDHCRGKCPLQVSVGRYLDMQTSAKENRLAYRQLVHKEAQRLTASKKKGLGDWVESAIDALTFGRAKELMEKREQKTGKPCGCKKRKDALNKLGGKVGFHKAPATGGTEEPGDAS